MKWVKEFYSKQNKWAKAYEGNPTDYHNNKVRDLNQSVGAPPLQVLELGAGGGQFSVSAALAGYHVTAVEIVPDSVKHIRKLCEEYKVESFISIKEEDFYRLDYDAYFDAICYWDGFGIGTDEDQTRLLNLMEKWLKPGGSILMDVYTPWFWSYADGQNMKFGEVERRYTFNAFECRMEDSWWLSENPSEVVTQSLRCYSPADLQLLLKNTNLTIDTINPGGALDYNTMEFTEKVDLSKAMSYRVKIIKK
ncbi:class I SAM-dependent methyltransferase [Bacillus carboniphilus]|uniref:Class I SAM-dependent methyltransferase n=1 Tax=Bacillus carboniphilus TaxID=86663 RepID=A0ABN0W1U5_9BACI